MSRRRKALAVLMRARMTRSPATVNSTTTPTAVTTPASDVSPVPAGTSPSASRKDNVVIPIIREAGLTEHLKCLIQACVSDSAEALLEDFLQGYYKSSSEERKEVLLALATDCDVDRARVRYLMQQYLSLGLACSHGEVEDKVLVDTQEDGSVSSTFYRIEHNLRIALKPKYGIFVEKLNAYPGGLKLLVDVRGDLLSMLKEKNIAPVRALDSILKERLVSWLSPASLELHQITWDDSASILEKIVAYEAVHPIRNLLDLKRRLSVGRRCFAYLHPTIPGEPLIFIEVALLKNIAQSIMEVLWDSPPIPENEATCALFYSISSTQPGLAGINLGKFLIKRVVELLKRDMPQVLTFATLSPIPGYIQWLQSKLFYHLKHFDPIAVTIPEDGYTTFSENVLHPEEERAIAEACPDYISGRNGTEIMQKLLLSPKNEWADDDQLLAVLKPPLMRLCARYLFKEKKRGKALDAVANFHLQNGAMIERLNWMANRSVQGLQQSGGIMVNYVYRSDNIEENARSYSQFGAIQASHSFCHYAKDKDL